MSAEAVGWVYRHSPLKGSALLVHLAVADSVNDQHYNEFWMSVGRLAEKSRVERRTAGRALQDLIEVGLLSMLEDHSKERKPSRYRFEFPEIAVVFESRAQRKHGSTEPMSRVEGTHAHGSPRPTNPIGTQESPTSAAPSTSSPPRKERQRDEVWDALTAFVGPVSTKAETSRRAGVVKQLKAVGADAREIELRCAVYHRKWPRTDLTDTALQNHWSKLTPRPEKQVVLNGNAMDPAMSW